LASRARSLRREFALLEQPLEQPILEMRRNLCESHDWEDLP
jgi:hypothetical protein